MAPPMTNGRVPEREHTNAVSPTKPAANKPPTINSVFKEMERIGREKGYTFKEIKVGKNSDMPDTPVGAVYQVSFFFLVFGMVSKFGILKFFLHFKITHFSDFF
jgi:hypothetical protein